MSKKHKTDKKGLEMPINALIIILVAVIVLAAAIAIFTGIWTPGQQGTEQINQFKTACAKYAAAGCCAGGSAATPPAACTTGADSLQTKLEAAARAAGIPETNARAQCCG